MISVIIPTCQRHDLLERCLGALSPGRQTLPAAEYEVIVSDDGFRADTRELVQTAHPWAKWVQGPRRGPASNRNHGAKQAQGDWLAFVDDDCQPDPVWLEAIGRAVRQDAPEIIEGRTVCPGKRDDPFEEHIENLTGGLFWSCNLTIRRDIFNQLNGFDEDFLEAGGEDMEFAWRIGQSHLRTLFVPDALVIHPVRRITWRRLWWRVFLMRWILLYGMKTGQSLPLETPWPRVIANLLLVRVLNLLRTSKQRLKELPRGFWRRNLFFLVWHWLTFPVVLPYLVLWEIRFRRQLMSRSPRA